MRLFLSAINTPSSPQLAVDNPTVSHETVGGWDSARSPRVFNTTFYEENNV